MEILVSIFENVLDVEFFFLLLYFDLVSWLWLLNSLVSLSGNAIG